MPQWSISILKWERILIRPAGENGILAKRIQSKLLFMPNTIPPGLVETQADAIRTRIF
jgi:hypothetical protein